MKPSFIRLASDLHLEAFTGMDPESLVTDFLPANVRDQESVLALVGDISSKPEQLLGFLAAASQKFMHVLYVPGNHEYYRHEFNHWNRDMRKELAKIPNLSFSTDDVVEVQMPGVRFLMTTLWGDGGLKEADRVWVDRGLNDFRVIRLGETRFTVHDMRTVHKRQKRGLVKLLATEFDGKTVVCTHHLPSYRLCHPRFGTDINGGFASNCDAILAADNAPDIWLHGHTHDTRDDVHWKTRIVCNPAGYRGEWDSPFNTYHEDGPKFIELS